MIEKSKGWCCELCGRLIKGYCENNKGYVTCLYEDCISGEENDLIELKGGKE